MKDFHWYAPICGIIKIIGIVNTQFLTHTGRGQQGWIHVAEGSHLLLDQMTFSSQFSLVQYAVI